MSFIRFHYRPWATYLIVTVNVLVFLIFSVFTFGAPGADNLSECIKNTSSKCLKYKNLRDDKIFKEVNECARLSIKDGSSSADCYYNFDECLKNQTIFDKCISGQDKLYSKYGFDGSNLGYLRWHTLITSMFVHDGFGHLFYNMVFLLIAGALVESRIKARKFFILYFVSGILASITGALFYSSIGKEGLMIGASGAISGLLGANLILNYFKSNKEETAMIFGHIPSYGFSVGMLAVFFYLDLLYGLFSPDTGIGHAVHISGFVIGFILILFLKDREEKYSNL